jgi:hypothetical protein
VALGVVVAAAVAALASLASPAGDHRAAAATRSLPPFTVKAAGPSGANQLQTASASCDAGDQATGGGFEGVDFATTRIVDNSPFESINSRNLVDTWTVDYQNGANAATRSWRLWSAGIASPSIRSGEPGS